MFLLDKKPPSPAIPAQRLEPLQMVTNLISGYIPGRITLLCLNLHLKPRPIWMSRHGESEFNMQVRFDPIGRVTCVGVFLLAGSVLLAGSICWCHPAGRISFFWLVSSCESSYCVVDDVIWSFLVLIYVFTPLVGWITCDSIGWVGFAGSNVIGRFG